MRRKAVKFVFLAFAFLVLTALASVSEARTIYVPDDYEKIQWAVDNASVGDTIVVRDGVYVENIDINKPHLTIKSENGSAKCVVQAKNSHDHAFEVTADNVTIKGFTVTGASSSWKAGIHLYNSNNCRIENVNASNNWYGIHFYNSSNNIIANNIVSSSDWGDGIYLYSSSNNTIANNTASSNNWCGIRLRYSSNNIIANNIVSSSDWGDGIYLYSSSNNTIANNTVSNNYDGIELWSSSNNNIIANNNASSNNDYGIALGKSSNNNIANNTVSSNWCGILLGYSSNNIIANNTVSSNNYDGIALYYCSNNIIANNNVSSNNDDGIHLGSSNNNIIANNTASSNNEDGIYLAYSSKNTIANNTASNNDDGIYLWYSSKNTIADNIVSSNNDDGISLYSSINNFIYLNNFIDNTDNVYSYDSTNIWNSTEKITYKYNGSQYTNYLGNYWSDYTGSDANGDGIGDTPYSIDSDKDYYPLMRPFEHYFVPDEPKVSISTDKYEYRAGDVMLINITFENPTDERKSVKFLWRLDIYDYNLSFTVINNKSLLLPPEFEKTFVIPWRLPELSVSFNASWYVALYDGIISEDTADWRYIGVKKKGEREIAGDMAELGEIERSALHA